MARGFTSSIAPLTSAPVNAGDRFDLDGVTMLALDGPLVMLRGVLLRYLGFAAHRAVDAALVAVADRNQPGLVLAGPRGCQHERLARAIHVASCRRGQTFEMIGPQASRRDLDASFECLGSLYVDVAPLRGRPASAALARALFGVERLARPIIAAPDVRTARAVFDHAGDEMRAIEIPPVRQRLGDVPRLLDMLLAELGPHRVDELSSFRREAICSFDWPLNHEDLRRTAVCLHAYLHAGRNMSAAARSLGLRSPDTLTEALLRVGAIA